MLIADLVRETNSLGGHATCRVSAGAPRRLPHRLRRHRCPFLRPQFRLHERLTHRLHHSRCPLGTRIPCLRLLTPSLAELAVHVLQFETTSMVRLSQTSSAPHALSVSRHGGLAISTASVVALATAVRPQRLHLLPPPRLGPRRDPRANLGFAPQRLWRGAATFSRVRGSQAGLQRRFSMRCSQTSAALHAMAARC